MRVRVEHGDSRKVLKTLADDSVSSVVTDPPYSLQTINKRYAKSGRTDSTTTSSGPHQRTAAGFMGKKWDTGDTAFDLNFWCEVYRVLKPGGHVLAFGGTRTYHRLVCAIEDGGFEIRDTISWNFGSGFPKSHSVSKTIIPMIESRYGNARTCDCLASSNGRPARDDAGRSAGKAVRVQRPSRDAAPKAIEDPILPIRARAAADTVRELQQGDSEKAARSQAIKEAVLLSELCGGGTEEAGLGSAAVRPRLEESESRDTGEGQELPRMRQDASPERRGAACASPETLSVRRDKSARKSRRSVRDVPPQDRGSDGAGFVLDKDRRDSRRVVPDDQCGWETAVAHVCSWCGCPDAEWLENISGLGTALKPAMELICVGRKPLIGTVAANVLEHGTGALNIDGCRVETGEVNPSIARRKGATNHLTTEKARDTEARGEWKSRASAETYGADHPGEQLGRWPANVVHDGSPEVVEAFPFTSSGAGAVKRATGADQQGNGGPAYGAESRPAGTPMISIGDAGSAARFFYSSKADADDRLGSKHPTVKPVDLMRWLVRLVTPPGGLVLDPFAGSGTTGMACLAEGFDCLLIEREAEYVADIRRRLAHVRGDDTPLFAGPAA